MKKIVLIDGHSILNRAFYGIPDLTNSEGIHTGAVYGFLNIMFSIVEEEQPEYLTVAFDVHAPTFRHELFAEYKGTRSPMPEELRSQVPLIQDVLSSMGIQICKLAGYEADDVLGTIAKRCQKEGLEVSLVSGDRDLLQIADDHIKIRIPKTKGGKTQIEDYYPDDVKSTYGVTPRVFIDMKALMGDSSDNIAGVKGIGPKSAEKLLVTYGDLDGIYAHIDEMKPSAQKENLIRDKESAYFSKKLVTILTDAPVDFNLESARIGNFYNENSYVFFKKLEFKNFLNRFDESNVMSNDITKCFNVISDEKEAETKLNNIAEDINRNISIKSLAIYAPEKNKAISIAYNLDEVITFDCEINLCRFISNILEKSNISLVLYDAKKQYNTLGIRDIIGIENRCDDISIAAYLLDPLKGEYPFDYIASLYCDLLIPSNVQDELLSSAYITYVSLATVDIMKNKLSELDMLSLYKNIEMPLSRVLNELEYNGIRVQPSKLRLFSENLGTTMKNLEEKIYLEAGEKFNILSPKQLGYILFEKMGLPGGKKTKTGYSTSADVLEKLKDKAKIISYILEYRAVSKLKSTYADGLVNYIDKENRIHSSFHQTITATGRISSSEPNLQNIPTRTDLGREFRSVFIPSEGNVLVDADYSQIELRILAHMAGDKELILAYKEGQDIHSITAAKVFGIPLDHVTPDIRRNAKAVNFGIVYGISSFGLSEDLGISRKEASEYIEQYFETFPGIKKYLDDTVSTAKTDGFVTTMYGRRRPIPELSSSNFMQRQFGERAAMNSPIQGTAADIMKIAMIRVYRRFVEEGLKSKLILQVHDELLVDAVASELGKVSEILKYEMEHAADLSVAMEVDLQSGNDWLEAH